MLEHDITTPDIETSGADYAARFAGPVGDYFLGVQADTVQRLLSGISSRGQRALDVGGGHGMLTRLLLARGYDVWVQGSAASCSERLASLMKEADGRLHFVASSLWALPFADRSFDLVLGTRLLAHVERWQALLREMARVCRQSLLVEYAPIMSANILGSSRLFGLKRRIEGNTRPFFCYSRRQLAPVLQDAGFVDLAEEKQFLMPMVVHRAMKRPGLSRRIEAWNRGLGLTQRLGSPALLLAQRPRDSRDMVEVGSKSAIPAPTRRFADGLPHRVLLVAPQAFFAIAGTPLNIRNMCKVLTEIGYEVHLATLPLGQTIEMPGLIYHRVAKISGLNEVPIGFSFAKLAYDLLLAVEIIRLLRKQRFAVVHAIEDAAFFAAPIAGWFRTPMVTDLDSDICGQLLGNRSAIVRSMATLARPLRRLALRRSTCALTVAGALTRLVQAESPQTPVFEIKDIPGEDLMRPANPDAVERLRAELDLPKEGLIVYTGNFDSRQGVENLIEAMPLVLEKHEDSVLLMVGGAPSQIERLRHLAKRIGVGHAVRLIGQRPVEQMPEFMAMANVLASPRLEPYVTPLKIYAYMASGRPIVATDLPTHTDVLDLNSAILTQPDPQGLAEGIMRVLNEPARSARLGLRARQLVLSEHTYDAFRSKLAEVYAYAVAQGRAGALKASAAD